MAADPRHLIGAVLTFTMFAMLGNMIKKDHFDPVEATLPEPTLNEFEGIKVTEKAVVSLPMTSEGPWFKDSPSLKPCWTKPPLSKKFQDIYDINKFLKSLDGVVKVTRDTPVEISSGKLAVVRVPNRVTEEHIFRKIEPIFMRKGNLRLATYFPSINVRKPEEKTDSDLFTCVAMYGALGLQPEMHEVVDLMVERLRTLSRNSGGQFIAVDLRLELLEKKGCRKSDSAGRKSCYNPHEIGVFLQKMGFNKDTTIYLTQSKWHSGLDALKNLFPKTYTKEAIIPTEKKLKFFNSRSTELEKALDIYVCSLSDVFVPAISGVFYVNVAGKRIALGKTQILVPDQTSSSASMTDFISPYISKKDHFAYSCFC
ncbi:hypothetical protein Sjap_022946 [Stephania japonica]|uniref:O-fucosyltransferase family protein n=1 Tax=Stephania japonica TaxID=461633 RepID=A0AAP0EYL9_9MAGN